MRRVFALILLALVAVAVLPACSGTRVAPAKPPPVDAETRLSPMRRPAKEEPIRILAPPPAYGNKIVMGESRPQPRL